MRASTYPRPLRAVLRWLAVIPATIGLILGFFALVWTEWSQLLTATALLTTSAATWRALSGAWPLAKTKDNIDGTAIRSQR